MAALFCVKLRHGRHLEIMMSSEIWLVGLRVFIWRAIVPNVIPIQFETMEP